MPESFSCYDEDVKITEIEKRLENYIQFGARDLKKYAKNYLCALQGKTGTLQHKKAIRIHEAAHILDQQSKDLGKNYRDLWEHILTPQVHQAAALLRREKESLKSLPLNEAQLLYREINTLLPVFLLLHNWERDRRRMLLRGVF